MKIKKFINTKKNHKLAIPLLIKILVSLVFCIFLGLNIFQKLDFRLYDALFHFRKEPPVSEKIVLVKIDDTSIKALGEWPWTRDVIADALLRLRELGAQKAIFDVEYISPSKNGINPSAEQSIAQSILNTSDTVSELVDQMAQAAVSGYYSKDEILELSDMLVTENIHPEFDNLIDFVNNNIARDNDEYFAESLQFFGDSYLTINHENLGYEISKEDIDYIKARILYSRVEDPDSLILKGNELTLKESEEERGFTPALNKLLSRAHGASFTNSVIDSDGVRRRMELLFEYNGKYIPQLAFGPFLDIVQASKVIRKKDCYIIKDAVNPLTNETGDIKIPVDPYGRILINWRRGSCEESFNNDSIFNLINLDFMEENIIIALRNIASQVIIGEDGLPLEYYDEALDLLDLYAQIAETKNQLLSLCTGYSEDGNIIDGISAEDYEYYFSLRNEFYSAAKAFYDKNHLPEIQNRLNSLSEFVDYEIISQIMSDMEEDFGNLLYIDAYLELNKELKTLYNGSWCIIGNTATSTTDNGATPLEKKFMNVGVHANILNTLVNQNFISWVNWKIGFIFAVILSFVLLIFINRSNLFQNLTGFICYFVYCLIWGALFVFSNYYIPFIGIIIYLAAELLAGISYRFFLSYKEKHFITQIAASFANKDTVEELRKNPEAFKTEGQKKCITALFSDIQKFSTLSESIGKIYGEDGPNKLIEILNDYLGHMSDEILKNGGNIDKYEGDAIISMFGAPDPTNLHTPEEWAYLCLDSALKMKKVEVEFNKTHSQLFEPVEITEAGGKSEIIQLKPLQTRIGVNSGEAFVGLMGSKTESFSKLNYTMIGDTVNLASRLEGVNKAYNSWIMCSDETWNMANTGANKDKIIVRRLDKCRVVGRSTPVQLYNVVGFADEMKDFEFEKIELFHSGLDKYLERDFKEALKLFTKADKMEGGDPTSLVFAERCKTFIEKGVPENWDGVVNMTSK